MGAWGGSFSGGIIPLNRRKKRRPVEPPLKDSNLQLPATCPTVNRASEEERTSRSPVYTV